MPNRPATFENSHHSPGALRGGAVLALHSRQAARLVKGRSAKDGQPAILGLFGFARMLRPLHEGVAELDPYAHWWLKKVSDEIHRADEILMAIKTALTESMDPDSGFSIAEVTSELPMLVELRFATREAYAAARTLSSFDRTMLEALSARHVGLITDALVQNLIDQGGTAIRRLFFSPIGYRRTGVRAVDIRADNRIARHARELMGLLPDDMNPGALPDGSLAIDFDTTEPVRPSISSVLTAAQ